MRSIAFTIIYFSFIFKNISMFSLTPLFFLLVFVLIILKISMRSNKKQLDESLDNISSVDTL